jgi:hypothetical protein
VALTDDGGATWTVTGRPTFSGAVFGGAYVPDTHTVIAAGPKGLDYSSNDGALWNNLSANAYWGLGLASRAGWAVGPGGRVTKVSW